MLYVDGHNSHINMRFLDWCYKHRIYVVMFPSHATHRLQPLDVSCFSPLSQRYCQHLMAWIARHGGIITLGQRDFYSLFKLALIEALTPHNIESAWKKTGLFPFDPTVVLKQLDRNAPEAIDPHVSDSNQLKPIKELPNWRRLRREIAGAKNGNPLNHVLLEGFEALSAQNVILNAELLGIKESVKLLQKKQVRSKNIFEKILEEDGSRAIFFSPKKIKRARQLEAERLLAEEREQEEKDEKALNKRLAKEEKERREQERREERKRAQEQRAVVAAQKRAEIDARKRQREENRRQSQADKLMRLTKRKDKQLKIKKTVVVDVESDKEPESSKSAITRAGRQTRPRKHFDETLIRSKL